MTCSRPMALKVISTIAKVLFWTGLYLSSTLFSADCTLTWLGWWHLYNYWSCLNGAIFKNN